MVNIATLGMFKSCCGGAPGGGGAPPYRQNAEESVTPVIFIRNVKMVTINSPEDLLSKIHIRLKDND